MRTLTIINRGLSLLIAVALVVGQSSIGASTSQLKLGLCLMPILCLIWFGEQIGSFTGAIGRGGHIDTESPGWLVATMGWVLLLGVPVILALLNR